VTPAEADWTPTLVALAIGVVLGIALLWRLRRARLAQRDRPASVADTSDLEARRDAALARLREIDQLAPNQHSAELTQERRRLELDAARALMELDRQATAPPARLPRGAWAPGSTLRGFLWGVGSVGIVALLFYFASQSGKSQPPTTPAANDSQAAATTTDAETAALRAQIEKDPGDLAARLDLARHALAANDMMTVFNETRFILERQPAEPRALTYQAVVRLAMGQPKNAEEMLERALAAQPDLEDAYVYLMLVHTETGNARAADTVLERAVKRLPAEAEALRTALARMQSEAKAGATAPRELPENPHAALDSGAPMPSAAMPAGVLPGQSVAGSVDLVASVQRPSSPRAALYVLVRAKGQTSGPPLAVKRLPAVFPAAFEVSAADSMTGATLPSTVRIEARLAADGDATNAPGQPHAAVDDVLLGTRNLHLTLAPSP
jgi:tetratricopeptide (TPR) repeat protein